MHCLKWRLACVRNEDICAAGEQQGQRALVVGKGQGVGGTGQAGLCHNPMEHSLPGTAPQAEQSQVAGLRQPW